MQNETEVVVSKKKNRVNYDLVISRKQQTIDRLKAEIEEAQRTKITSLPSLHGYKDLPELFRAIIPFLPDEMKEKLEKFIFSDTHNIPLEHKKIGYRQTPEQKGALIDSLRHTDLTIEQTAQKFGLSTAGVFLTKKKLGLVTPRGPRRNSRQSSD